MTTVAIHKHDETLYFNPENKRFSKNKPEKSCTEQDITFAQREFTEFWEGLGFTLDITNA